MTLKELPKAVSPHSNPLLSDLKETDFQLWRHHPVSECFLTFLAHLADNYRLGHLERWETPASDPGEGRKMELLDHEARGRILMLEDLRELNLADMKRYYSVNGEADAA